MYKPKVLTESELDKFIADLEATELADFYRATKQPVRHLHLLEGIAGGTLLLGSLLTLVWILYGVYEKIHGGIQ